MGLKVGGGRRSDRQVGTREGHREGAEGRGKVGELGEGADDALPAREKRVAD